jgi:hypothetical protein
MPGRHKFHLHELPQLVPVALKSPLRTAAVSSFASMKPEKVKYSILPALLAE